MISKILAHSRALRGPGRCLLLMVMLLPLVSVAPVQVTQAASRIHPILLLTAQQSPDAKVNVIVQKSVKDSSVEDLATRLGGTVTQDLHIINAFAAEMTAKEAAELAKSNGVKWISPNSPVAKTTTNPYQFTTWATDSVAASSSSILSNFNSSAINLGGTIWFNSVFRVNGVGSNPVTVNFDDATIVVSIYGQAYSLPVPSATITFSPTATTATTTYDTVNGRWVTVVPSQIDSSNIFLSGMGIRLSSGLPGSAVTVGFSGRFTTDTAGVTVNSWKWAAAAYANFSSDYNAIGVKPCDDGNASQYRNSDKAGTPENYRHYVVPGARGNGGNNYTGDYSNGAAVSPARVFTNAQAMVELTKRSKRNLRQR